MAKPRSSMMKYMISFILSVIFLTAAFTLILLSFQRRKNTFIIDYLENTAQTATAETAKRYYSLTEITKFKNLEEIIDYMMEITDSRLLSVVIFSQTEDENYFRVREIIHSDKAFKTPYTRGNSISPAAEKNFIRTGLSEMTVDPKIHRERNFFWQNAYFPVKTENSTYSLQLSVNTSYLENPISMMKHEDLVFRKYIFISISLFLSITVLISLLYMHNLTLFINSLSHVVKKAVNGETKFRINHEADEDFRDLAYSFNSLISEMKEKDRKISELSEKDHLDDIFRKGVQMLKDNMLEEAEAVFSTLSYIKPDGFGCYFNLGVINAKKKNYALSLEMFLKASESNPSHELTNTYIQKVKGKLTGNV